MAKTRGSRDVAHRMRFILDEALTKVEELSSMDLAELVAQKMIEEGVIEIARKFAPFIPKTVDLDMSVSRLPLDTTMLPDNVLEQIHEYKRQQLGMDKPALEVINE